MLLALLWCACYRGTGRLVFGPTEASHMVVDGSRKINDQDGFSRLDCLWEVDGCTLGRFVVRDVRELMRFLGCFETKIT